MVIIALRTRSAELLAEALLADALSGVFEFDWRDSMVSKSVHFTVARELGLSPAALFDDVADRLPPGGAADQMRSFGRSKVILAKFGHELVQTPDGPDLIPTGILGRLWREAQEPPVSPLAKRGELQTLGHEIAGRLGTIVEHCDVGVTWSALLGSRVLTNSTGWTRNLWCPEPISPAALLELPFLVRARFTAYTPHWEEVDVEVALVDPDRLACSGAVRYTGRVDPDWTLQAPRPSAALAAVASAMTVVTRASADRGDITTSVAILNQGDDHLVLCVGEGNVDPRPATIHDLQRLRDRAEQMLDALASSPGHH
jgi:hypothetical protein